jgi:hypothetical protein
LASALTGDVPSVLVLVLAGLLVVSLAVGPAVPLLRPPLKVAGIGAGVAMGGVLDQLFLGLLEALRLAAAAFTHGALLLAAALLEREMIFFFHADSSLVENPAHGLYPAT